MNMVQMRSDVTEAADDLRRRTLGSISRPLDRLIYLASTRDYNTGFYYHDGLAARFSNEVVCEAVAECHREAFHQILNASLHDLVRQMDEYMASTHTSPRDFVAAWKNWNPTEWLCRWERTI
jgi:hypothetical protein